MNLIALSDRAYMLQGEVQPDHVRENAGFVVSERGVVVIDTTRTLSDATWAYRQIRATTDKPIAYVINTHFHPDHVFGNQVFEAPKIAHELCLQRMRALLSGEWSAESLAQMARAHPDPEALRGLRIVLPEITFSDRLALELGDLRLEVIHLGGHTPGLSVVYLPQEKLLYISDLLFVERYPALMHANVRDWIAALERIKGMGVEKVVPGHGRLSGLAEAQRIQDYLVDLKQRVADLAKRGLSREQIMSHPSFPRYAERAYPSTHQANIGVAYDQMRQEAGG